MRQRLPVTFELRRLLPKMRNVWMSWALRTRLPAAPVYMFESQDLDRDEMDPTDTEITQIQLPHSQCVFEVEQNPRVVGAHAHGVALCWQDDEAIHGLLVRRYDGGRWTEPELYTRLEGMQWEYEANPGYQDPDMALTLQQALGGFIARGCKALDIGDVAVLQAPGKKLRQMAGKGRTGRTGFEYRVITIDPSKLKPTPRGGTHASPRWHVRRGHWRAVGGRRVWVRECEVGDISRGGIVKDYEVRVA